MAVTMSLLLSKGANSEEQPSSGDAAPQAAASPDPGTPATPDDDWHTDFTFYLWFPGTHGTTGVNGHDVNFRASAGDILSHFRFGLMGTLGVQRGRFVGIGDLIWVRLAAYNSRTLPFPGLPELSSTVKAQQFILTPEFGYRFLDHEKIKIDALMGLRYWHLGSSLQFTPSLGLNVSPSANWVDPLMGTRIVFPLSPKAEVTILGDAGGWGAGSQLDYQIVGALRYNLKPKWTLGVGYRYLFVNYHPGNFLYESALTGPMIGVTYHFK
jgi:hypothetical protein